MFANNALAKSNENMWISAFATRERSNNFIDQTIMPRYTKLSITCSFTLIFCSMAMQNL